MIKILIVDDDLNKLGTVKKEIEDKCGCDNVEIIYKSCAVDVYEVLKNKMIDIMILDICFPLRIGDKADKNAGIDLLKRLKTSKQYVYPRFVVALSQYEDLVERFSEETGLIHTSISYNLSNNTWKIRLIDCVNTAIAILSNNVHKRDYDYDIAIICALKEELEIFKQLCKTCEECKIDGDDNTYEIGIFDTNQKEVRIVMTSCTQMGMVSAAALATKMIYNFAPKYLVMIGIAAGVKGKVNLGDVVVAEYVWDYGAGKETIEDGVSMHRNTIQQIQIDTEMTSLINKMSDDYNTLASIKRSFNGPKPQNELKLFLGPMASGSSVIADSEVIKKIQDQIRDVLAIEMEIYGVYYASRWAIEPKPKYLALKGICDFADECKNDDYHGYAAYTSAKVLEELVKKYFTY